MKILIVASNNKHKYFAPFIVEQAKTLQKFGCEIEYYGIKGNGFWGYISNYKRLYAKIKTFKPDIVHAHYGLAGLFANLQCKVPVVTTYHGSDINNKKARFFSRLSIKLSAFNIFVSKRTLDIIKPRNKYALIPCGVNVDEFKILSKDIARKQLGVDLNHKFVLFAGAFDNKVKNADLAFKTISSLKNVDLKECKGYTRQQMVLLMNAADALLMTSHTEGSPQVVKEAMACGCPIVSVDVGDVAEIIEGVDKCYIAKTYDAKELADLLSKAILFKGKTNGRERILELNLDNKQIAEKLIELYKIV